MTKPQTIRRYHIFLASPGDVGEQRKFVRSFFGDYNIQHAAARGIEFHVVDWENYATIGIGELATGRTTPTFWRSGLYDVGRV